MPRLPLSANSCAIEVSKTRQSEFIMADETPSCMDLGVASHVRRRRWPFSSSLDSKFAGNFKPSLIQVQTKDSKIDTYRYAKFSACFLVPINWTMAKNCWWPSNFSCFSKTSLRKIFKLYLLSHSLILKIAGPPLVMVLTGQSASEMEPWRNGSKNWTMVRTVVPKLDCDMLK